MSHSTMVACLNQVTSKCNKGAKCKSAELGAEMQTYWEDKIFLDRVDMVGRSRLKVIVADQMEMLILANATTHFWSRYVKTCILQGLSKSEARRSVSAAFAGRWEEVPPMTAEWLKGVIPAGAQKQNVHYDMKVRPSEYVRATFKLALMTKALPCRAMCFSPLRTSCVPCHVKLDTECFLLYKAAVEARKTFWTEGSTTTLSGTCCLTERRSTASRESSSFITRAADKEWKLI